MVPRRLGRYLLYESIASGGMASVHLGRSIGDRGFARTVAIKRLHPHLATDTQFVASFLDEARLAARINHPNVISTLDVVSAENELFVVMEYVAGQTLSQVLSRLPEIPLPIASAIATGTLYGLHAAHEARDEHGVPLAMVHRDVSPQNVLLGVDGLPRVLDFGIAKAASRLQTTQDGAIKGKLGYMSPQQLRNEPLDRRSDVYSAAVVFWELIAKRRLFHGADPGAVVTSILLRQVPPLEVVVPPALAACVARGLSTDPNERPATALEFARQWAEVVPPASQDELAQWVRAQVGDELTERSRRLAEIESAVDAPLSRQQLAEVVTGSLEIPPTAPPLRALRDEPASATPNAMVANPERRNELDALEVNSVSDAPRPRRRGAMIALICLVVVIAAGVGLAFRRAGATEIQAPVEPVAAPTKTVEPFVAAPEQPAPAPIAAPAPVKKKVTGKNVKRAQCQPPTYVDERGIRRIKPGCY